MVKTLEAGTAAARLERTVGNPHWTSEPSPIYEFVPKTVKTLEAGTALARLERTPLGTLMGTRSPVLYVNLY